MRLSDRLEEESGYLEYSSSLFFLAGGGLLADVGKGTSAVMVLCTRSLPEAKGICTWVRSSGAKGAERLYTVERQLSLPSVQPLMGPRGAVGAVVVVLNALTLATSGQSAALIRRAAIITPLLYSLKLCSDDCVEESDLEFCMIGAGAGMGGKLYKAARVAMLGDTCETLVQSLLQLEESLEVPLLESLSSARLAQELLGTAGMLSRLGSWSSERKPLLRLMSARRHSSEQ